MGSDIFQEDGAKDFPEWTNVLVTYEGGFRDDHLILTQSLGSCDCFS